MPYRTITAQDPVNRIEVTLADGQRGYGYVNSNGELRVEIFPPRPQPGQPQPGDQPGNGRMRGDGPGESYRRPVDHLKDIPADVNFKSRLASTLKDNASNRIQHNLKRGKLDMKRLWKAATNTDTIFQKKQAHGGKKYNVTLLVDESGSMSGPRSGPRIEKAAHIAGFLADNFQAIAIDLNVLGYSNVTKARKKFEETVTGKTLQARIVGDMMSGGTDDYSALKEAYKLLQKRDGESIVIVVTDGDGCSPEQLRPLIEKNKRFKTFAIGIGDKTPRGYTRAIEVNNLDELKPAVLNILKSQITRR